MCIGKFDTLTEQKTKVHAETKTTVQINPHHRHYHEPLLLLRTVGIQVASTWWFSVLSGDILTRGQEEAANQPCD